MARSSLSHLSQRILAEADPEDGGARLVNMRVDLVAQSTGDLIVAAGGEWDRRFRKYTGREPAERLVLGVHQGQEAAARWFAEWLRGYARRDPLIAFTDEKGVDRPWITWHLHGGRGSGKTDLAVDAFAVFHAAVPKSIGWIISDVEEDDREIRDYLSAKLPAHWYTFFESADPPYYLFANGSKLYLRSAAKPAKLKAGRVDLALWNEPQKMHERAYAYVLPRIQDTGGLAVLASNPPEPDMPRGRWIEKHIRAVDAGKLRDEKLFRLHAKDNPWVESGRLEQLHAHMSEQDYRLMMGELVDDPNRIAYAYYEETHRKPVGIDPRSPANGGTGRELRELTNEFLEAKLHRDHFDAILGCDFDKKPHIAATLKRAYADPDEPPFEAGGDVLLWSTRLFLVEPGNEEELCLMLLAYGLDPGRTAVVADASARWQSTDRKESRVTGKGSWDVLKKYGFIWIFPPHPKMLNNPIIGDRVSVMNGRLRCKPCGDRIHEYIDVDQNLDDLSEAATMYEKKNGGWNRRSKYAHRFDAWAYPTYRLYPQTWKMKGKVEFENLGERTRAGVGRDVFRKADETGISNPNTFMREDDDDE